MKIACSVMRMWVSIIVVIGVRVGVVRVRYEEGEVGCVKDIIGYSAYVILNFIPFSMGGRGVSSGKVPLLLGGEGSCY